MNRALALIVSLLSPLAAIAAPIAEPDAITMHLGGKARIEVLANDTGVIAHGSVVIAQPPQFGTAVPDATGRILYTAPAGIFASDTFTYRVSGEGETSAPATVTVQFSNQLRVPPAGHRVPLDPPPTEYQFVPAFGGLKFYLPVCQASPPADTKRLFVCELWGGVYVIPDVNAPNPTRSLFLNLHEAIATREGETIDIGIYWEDGLRGLVFHPQYAQNGTFFVFYSLKKSDGFYYERLSRFHVREDDPLAADPHSELILIDQLDEERNHNGGDMHFGPDGYLYFSTGDEGEQFDLHQNSQHIDHDFFSGVFRIDVDKRSGSLAPNPHPAVPLDNGVARYAVPPDNPFVGATSFNGLPVLPTKVRTEFWATGLRSPWRFSFDSATGDLWLGDVGQFHYEEMNLITKGGNYGWVFREGAHGGFRTAPPGFSSIDPVFEYEHVDYPGDAKFKGNSIIAGRTYRGSRFAALDGAHICSDYVSANVWALRRNGAAVTVEWITSFPAICTYGTDPSNGDVLASLFHTDAPLYRLTTVTPVGTYPHTLGETGLFADLTDLTPNPGVLPYEPNLAFWSDHATKQRWFALPNAASLLGWSRDGAWAFPTGSLWVKHFDLELERGNPATQKRIETRVLVKNTTGVYGVSYRWNAAQTDAELVPAEGADLPLAVVENGVSRTQRWRIPGRGECLACHTSAAGHVLSFDTRQLNRTASMNGFVGNQLDLLRLGGFFSNSPPSPNLLPRHVRPDETAFSLESRVRSYLAVNCSQCHRPGAGAPPTWDARPELTLAQTLLLHGVVQNNGGNSANRLVVPGDTAHSVVLHRLEATGGFTRMPPVGTAEIDAAGCALLAQWITSALPARQTYDQWRLAQFSSATSPEGARTADPDADSRTNEQEFLVGTLPRAFDRPQPPSVSITGNSITLSADLPPDRAFQIEASSDLMQWSLWDAPGNNGFARSGPVSITGSMLGPQKFFRFRLWEP